MSPNLEIVHPNILKCKCYLYFPSRRRTSHFKRCKITILLFCICFLSVTSMLNLHFSAKPNSCLSASTVDTFIDVPKMASKCAVCYWAVNPRSCHVVLLFWEKKPHFFPLCCFSIFNSGLLLVFKFIFFYRIFF